MAKRDEEAAVEAVAVNMLIELSIAYTWICQQKESWSHRRAYGVLSTAIYREHEMSQTVDRPLRLLVAFGFWSYPSQFLNFF